MYRTLRWILIVALRCKHHWHVWVPAAHFRVWTAKSRDGAIDRQKPRRCNAECVSYGRVAVQDESSKLQESHHLPGMCLTVGSGNVVFIAALTGRAHGVTDLLRDHR